MNIIIAAAWYEGSISHLGMGYRNCCFHIQILLRSSYTDEDMVRKSANLMTYQAV